MLRTHSTIMIRNRQAIIALVMRSTPFCRPMLQMPKPSAMVMSMKTPIYTGCPSMPLKTAPTSSGVLPVNSPASILVK